MLEKAKFFIYFLSEVYALHNNFEKFTEDGWGLTVSFSVYQSSGSNYFQEQ